jgi:hypothetical protein
MSKWNHEAKPLAFWKVIPPAMSEFAGLYVGWSAPQKKNLMPLGDSWIPMNWFPLEVL